MALLASIFAVVTGIPATAFFNGIGAFDPSVQTPRIAFVYNQSDQVTAGKSLASFVFVSKKVDFNCNIKRYW